MTSGSRDSERRDDRISEPFREDERCWNRGPRVEEVVTRCFRPAGHAGDHWAHESFDNGGHPLRWTTYPPASPLPAEGEMERPTLVVAGCSECMGLGAHASWCQLGMLADPPASAAAGEVRVEWGVRDVDGDIWWNREPGRAETEQFVGDRESLVRRRVITYPDGSFLTEAWQVAQ